MLEVERLLHFFFGFEQTGHLTTFHLISFCNETKQKIVTIGKNIHLLLIDAMALEYMK